MSLRVARTTRSRRTAVAAGSTLLLAGLIALAWRSAAPAEAGGLGSFKGVRIGTFNQPVHVDNAPGFPNLLFVVEKPGRVRVMRNENKVGHPFLDIRHRVSEEGERGLLSIAFPPSYERSRRFYVYFTNNQGNVEIDQYRRDPDSATRAKPGSREKVIEIPHPGATNHNGGAIHFGPDGKLYLAPGDGGHGNSANAQDKRSLLGKVLRIKPRKNGGYSIPDGNPFVGKPGRNEIWARGLRNPFRFTFDSETGNIAIADVGENAREEANIERRADSKGANYGWDHYEGDIQRGSFLPGHHEPMFVYRHDGACGSACAITGGYVVRDPGLPMLDGRYIYADFYKGQIRSFQPNLQTKMHTDDQSLGVTREGLSTFGEGAERQIYFASLFSGRVFRLEPA